MPFVWVQNISIGADIDSVDIVEIRDAADFVLDNLCVIDNVGENIGEDGLDLNAEDGLDLTAEDGVENSDHNPAENGTDQTGLNDVENSDDNPALNGTDNLAEDGSALGVNQSPDNVGLDGGDRNPYYNAALGGEDYQEDTLDHTFNWATNYPSAVTDEYGAGDDSAAQSNV